MTLLAVSLVLGAAAASTSISIHVGPDGADVDFETDAIPRVQDPRENDTRPPPPPPRATFSVDVRPPSQNTTSGGSATYLVHLHAERNVTLHLALENLTRGYRAELGADHVVVQGGGNASVRLVMYAPDVSHCEPMPNSTVCSPEARGHVTVRASARDTNETHRDTAELVVTAPTPPPPPPANLTLTVWPRVQNATPGETVSYRILVNSTEDRVVYLNVTDLTPGYRASLEHAAVRAGPGGGGWTTLHVHVAENATKDGRVDLVAWTYEGERTSASAHVRLHDASTLEPEPPQNETSAPSAGASSAPPATSSAPVEQEWAVAVPLPRGGEARTAGGARAAIPMN